MCQLILTKSVCFIGGLQQILPEIEIKGKGNGRKQVKLCQAQANEFTLCTFQYIIEKNSSVLGRHMQMINEPKYDRRWWDECLWDCMSYLLSVSKNAFGSNG